MLEWLLQGTFLEGLSKGALPLGIFIFAGLVASRIWRRLRHRQTKHAFPALAERLGLKLRQSTDARAIGTASGHIAGYRVFIDPDDQRRISVSFSTEPRVDLRTYAVGRAAPRGLKTFFSGQKRFDSFFKTRFVSPEVETRLRGVPRLGEFVRPFLGPYYRQLRELNVTGNGVTCVLDFGHPAHIPPDAIEYLLPHLLALARLLDPDATDGPADADASLEVETDLDHPSSDR